MITGIVILSTLLLVGGIYKLIKLGTPKCKYPGCSGEVPDNDTAYAEEGFCSPECRIQYDTELLFK